jgi:fructan beta-fructosidase
MLQSNQKTYGIWWLFACLFCLLPSRDSRAFQEMPDLLIADFESPSYVPWEKEGDAFGEGPAKGTLPGQMTVDGYLGERLVNSFVGGDDSIGVLTSPEFLIERRYISFLIGGGRSEQLVLELELTKDGEVVRRASGGNTSPGGSERLASEWWDVADLIGKKARLRIRDNAQGSWGHLNVDHLVQTNQRPKGFVSNVERKFQATTRYLHLPIRNGAPKSKVTLWVDGVAIVSNEIELSEGEPDWWAPMDVSNWSGREVSLVVDRLHEDSQALANVRQSDELLDSDALYRESLRGQFHFSPRRGWNNDPNGCVFYRGEYHLFFQHNPYGWSWGNMHWGHAVSKDLVHWEELGDVLLPDAMGPMFSGSAVVDWKNTSGLGSQENPPLVLIYTAAGNPTVQGIAYSTDGRKFTKYQGNPIVPQVTGGNRDPKVFWHAPSNQWVMVLYVEWQGVHTVHFFTSPDLKDWTLASITPGDRPGAGFLFECPDFFELPVEGRPDSKKWVLMAANSDYGIGDFDGKRFWPDAMRLTGQRGKGFYAAQSFSDVPDGRRILIGWWRTETKGMPFNQSMTVPLELGLRQTIDGPRLTYMPVQELEQLRKKTDTFDLKSIQPGDPNPLAAISAELMEIEVSFLPGDAKELVLNLRDVMIEYDFGKQELSVAGHKAPAPLRDGRQRLVILVDRTGVEVFASDGLCYVPMPYNTNPENRKIFLEARGGKVVLESLKVNELKSAWEP